MSDTLLKRSLKNSPETTVSVTTGLHRDIMRAVRLAAPDRGRQRPGHVVPALAVVALAVFVAGLVYLLPGTLRVAPEAAVVNGQPQSQPPRAALRGLEESLLVKLKNTPSPEKSLREEMERLKSDLERFDFRS